MNIKNCKKLKRQAAGHDGPLTDPDEMLLFKPSNKQEIDFYEQLAVREVKENTNDVPFQDWTPTFLGVLQENSDQINDKNDGILAEEMGAFLHENKTANAQSDGKTYLVLENLLYGYVRPNVLDIKLGRVLWDHTADEEKKKRLNDVSKSSTSGSLGFRICGMNISANRATFDLDAKYQVPQDDSHIFINKYYGRELSGSNVIDAFDLFFGDDKLSAQNRQELIDMFLKRLQLFYNTLLNEEVRMVSSSLLFIYECDATRWANLSQNQELIHPHISYDSDSDEASSEDNLTASTSKKKELSRMSLIDFAHTKFAPGSGVDDNVIEGVESLIKIFEKLKTKYTI
ncbi:unnamed protein product [Kluyveromyces dobzhanskii CBS 2104]|uniref:Kinase n=1 Tax=Kluyveromyces dobzhanskii CBS 2104 TaxID=1427455 RepID=A0A0A8L701_9SACH|nr:unnamed protein product [Kluyveromyces dobzhanskii CBS 2104]